MAEIAKCVNIKAEDINRIVNMAKDENVDMAVIGPEVPLAMGIVDELGKANIKAFGPNKKCAQLEASKAFTKAFLARHDIPTAKYKEYIDKETLKNDIGIYGYPMIIKADGLAAGKGVVIAQDAGEAEAAIEDMMGNKVFGSAGEKIVVEECLVGVEASVLCFVDHDTIIPMESAQDYKRIYDGDNGPNTGGMGTYSPSLLFDSALENQIKDEILKPTLKGFKVDGLDFQGVLFIGIMITDKGPKVIEFNNRFGDPETQSVLMRLDSDLYDIFDAVCENNLSKIAIKWKEEKAVCVVLASGGYPGSYEKGEEIFGIKNVDKNIEVFHAGTAIENGKLVTAGGRVLGVSAIASTHEEAREKAYENIKRIEFKGAQYRNDIGTIVDANKNNK